MRTSYRGFSLVEVVIALGIIAFALVAILGMFPVAIGASRDSRTDTRAAGIARLIYGQLRGQPPDRASLTLNTNPAAGQAFVGHAAVNLKNAYTNWVAFDDKGDPLRSFAAAEYTNDALPANGAVYKVRFSVEPHKPVTNLSRVTVEVTYPALAPLSRRSTNVFATYLGNVAP